MKFTSLQLVCAIVACHAAIAQVPAPRRYVVRGAVFDSVAQRPLAGAVVQVARIANADSQPRVTAVRTDADGRFLIDGLAAGRYAIGFQHEALDGLGLESPLRGFELATDSSVVVDLATEPGSAVRRSRCGKDTGGPGDGMLAGFVLDAVRDGPAAGAKVKVRWVETALQQRGYRSTPHEVIAVAGDDGRYLACGVPSEGAIEVVATVAKHRTVSGQVIIPLGGALRQDFYLADSVAIHGDATLAGQAVQPDSIALQTGVVSIDALGIETPIRNGAFSLGGIPAGTWFVEVRAIGYEPRTLLLNATAGAAAPLRLVVDKKPQTLEGVTVFGKASMDTRVLNTIVARSKTSTGTVFLPGNSWLESATHPADVLRAAPGFHYKDQHHVEGRLDCKSVAVYLDGVRLVDLEMLTNAVPMKSILAIEAYPDRATAPLQFRTLGSADQPCAVVAVWTKH